MSVKIHKGVIQIYRVFDISEEIDLAKAELLLSDIADGPRLRLHSDIRKAIIMRDAPLSIRLGQSTLSLSKGEYTTNAYARVWNYGVISIKFELKIPKDMAWDELIALSEQLETVPQIDKLASSYRQTLKEKLASAISKDKKFYTSEDYITYIIEDADGIDNPREFINSVDVPALILASNERLSKDANATVMDTVNQYTAKDLAVIDWNSALLLEPRGERDVADVIEFSLTHLLEFRYYDDLLDNNLDELYHSMDNRSGGLRHLFNSFYSKLADRSSRKYIEFSELLSRVENSLKTIGDAYLAVIFRMTAKEFRFSDWKQSISHKMSTLAELTQMFHNELNVKRSHWLEIIVIILIAIELVPLIVNLYHFTKPAAASAPSEIAQQAES